MLWMQMVEILIVAIWIFSQGYGMQVPVTTKGHDPYLQMDQAEEVKDSVIVWNHIYTYNAVKVCLDTENLTC